MRQRPAGATVSCCPDCHGVVWYEPLDGIWWCPNPRCPFADAGESWLGSTVFAVYEWRDDPVDEVR